MPTPCATRSRACRLFAVLFFFAALACPGVAQAQATRILVLPFEVNAGPELGYLRESLQGLLVEKLREQGLDVVPVEEAKALLEQRKVTRIDTASARELTLLATAQSAIYGSFTQVGEAISLDARLVDGFGLKPDRTIFVTKDGLISILPAVEEVARTVRMDIMSADVVSQVSVEGLRFLDQDIVLMRVRTQRGEIYNPEVANQDLREVFNLGYFEDVRVEVRDTPEGKNVVFVIEEKPRVAAISLAGVSELSEDDILAIMNTKTGSVVNLRILADDLNRVRSLYRDKGFYLAEVSYRFDQTDRGTARLILDIKEGSKLYIRDISIRGASQLRESDLKSELALSERGFFSFLTGSGILKEDMLERDAAVIEAYYANRGFMDARVAPPEVEYRDDGIYITFIVEEGARYRVGEVVIRGDLIEAPDDLFKITTLDDIASREGFLDRSVIRDDVHKLAEHYAELGYAFAQVDVRLDEDRERQMVNVAYVISKRQKVFIRRVIIEGNTATRDNVIRRELLLGDGDRFSGRRISRSSERLNRLDYFNAVDIETVPTGDPAQMDLNVRVEEKATGMVSAGVGYSSLNRFFVGGQIQERNLFGRGYMLSLASQFGGRSTDVTASFLNPSIYDTKFSWGTELYWRTYDYTDYERKTIGGRTGIGYPVGEYTNVGTGYSLERFDITNVDSNAASVIKKFRGVNWSSTVDVWATRDTTDNTFMPTRGTLNKVVVDYSGGPLGGTTDFIKYTYSSHWFQSLMWGTIFHVHGTAGYVSKNYGNNEIPPWVRFYLGGIDDVRGYDGSRISPYDSATGDRIGGNKMFFTNLEYFFPISQTNSIWGLTFFDAGNAWDDDQPFFKDTRQRDGKSLTLGLYKSVGLGIRWNSPFGPLRLEYGYPLDKLRNSSDSGKFEFKIGGAF